VLLTNLILGLLWQIQTRAVSYPKIKSIEL
jgi:hypothetical protein